jgi:hypothetical protein
MVAMSRLPLLDYIYVLINDKRYNSLRSKFILKIQNIKRLSPIYKLNLGIYLTNDINQTQIFVLTHKNIYQYFHTNQ